MPFGQIDNPFGAFGYQTTAAQGQRQPTLHQQEIRVFRNYSRAPIQYGQAVTLYVDSTAPYGSTVANLAAAGTTVDDGVFVTAVASQRGIIGIALGACSSATGYSTVATTPISPRFNGPSSQYVNVVVRGPFYGALCTTVGHAPGDIAVNTASTVTDATSVTFGGIIGGASTVTVPVPSTVSSVQFTLQQLGTVGWFITTATTVNSTLYGSSGAGRANIWVQPGAMAYIFSASSVS